MWSVRRPPGYAETLHKAVVSPALLGDRIQPCRPLIRSFSARSDIDASGRPAEGAWWQWPPTRSDQAVFYFGAVAGGVWKSDDAGQFWKNVTDGFLTTGSIGALAVAPSDGNVIYAGTGESTIRIDVTHGDGVYKSTDAGVTWRHMGLPESRHIGEIRVHPDDPDLVYVAALGHSSKDNPERGLYRSKDGGENWELVLHVSERAGAVDVSLDPNNPRIIFATIWQTRRTFWSIDSGGPDSGLWRSRDGGDTWENISNHPGMPDGILGKIGVSVSPARSGRVFAMVEAEGRKRGLYRSDDFGETWEKVSSKPDLGWRPWYYQHVIAHPTDADEVFVMNMKAWRSIDGGKTFEEFHTPHGDNHALWIDPTNPDRMIGCDDGGAWVSFNAGESWSTIYNQLTAQFYHVATDDQFPYMVYGSQQDNSSIAVPSQTGLGAINWADCYPPGTAESGYVAPKPGDPNIVYVGAIGSSPGGGESLQRYDHTTKQVQLVNVWPESYHDGNTAEVRFQWTYPIVFSPHDSNVLYTAGNKVFRTTDEGHSWQTISPDLTYADPDTMGVSGPLTMDTAGAEMYATIFSLMVSAHRQGVLMAGSDDGLVHLSTNDGGDWVNVTPPDLPKFSQVTMIAESPHTAGTIYMTAARHKTGDYAPYVYKTADLGTTWTRIDAGSATARVLPCHSRRPQPPRSAVRGHRARDPRVVRRRRQLAVAAVQPSRHADLRLRRQGHRPRRGDSRTVVLDPRRPDTAAPDARRPVVREPVLAEATRRGAQSSAHRRCVGWHAGRQELSRHQRPERDVLRRRARDRSRAQAGDRCRRRPRTRRSHHVLPRGGRRRRGKPDDSR